MELGMNGYCNIFLVCNRRKAIEQAEKICLEDKTFHI